MNVQKSVLLHPLHSHCGGFCRPAVFLAAFIARGVRPVFAGFILILSGLAWPLHAATAPLKITSVSPVNGSVVVRWEGGTGPFQLLCRTNMTDPWRKAGQPTSLSSATNPAPAGSKACYFLITTDTTAPSAPGGLTVTTNSCSEIRLSWNAATDAGGAGVRAYDVFRGGVFLKQVPASTNATLDRGLPGGTSFSYAVRAVDGAGNESALSAAMSRTTSVCPNQPPIAIAGPDQTNAVGNVVVFSATGSRDPDGTIVSYNWTFGDGATATGTNVSRAYANTGTYTNTLTVIDNAGATSSTNVTVVITPISANSGQVVTATNLGGTTSDYGRSVAVDRNGNTFVGGSVNSRPFLAKISSSNSVLWSLMPAGASGAILGVAAASDGGVFVTGNFYAAIDFGGNPLTSAGGNDIFVARFSSSGAHIWSRRFGGAGGIASETGIGIAVDTNSNAVAVTGIFDGTVDFGGGPLTTTTGQDLFFAKFSATGDHLWSKCAGGSGGKTGSAAAFDGNGNVFFTGRFGQTVDFGGGSVTATGGFDMFLCKYSPTGSLLWVNHYGTRTPYISVSGSTALAVDRFGNPVVTGTFKFTMSFGGPLLTSAGYEDIFVAKYSGANGSHLWSKRFGDWNVDSANGVAVDGNGNITLSGWTATPLDFGGGLLPAASGITVYVVNLNTDGNHRWSKGIAVGSGEAGSAAADSFGRSFVTGRFHPSVNIGTNTLTSAGGSDIFLAEFAP